MNNFYNDKSLFRFSIIAPIINNTHGFASINEYISFAASKTYTFNNKTYKFSTSCIKNWYLSYKKDGISALQIKSREDKNSSRRLNYETILRIQELRQQFPNITGTAIYKKLIEGNYINKLDVSLSTVLRFINECFLHRTYNKVRKDMTVKFKNEFYEIPFKYIGQTIELRYDPLNLKELFLYENNKQIQIIKKVDKVANSKVKRKNGIDYSKVINNDLDVIEREE